MKINNKILYPLIVFFISVSVYIYFAGRFKFFFPLTIYNYFSFLAEAFLHDSLAFISNPPYLQDLTTVGDKVYMYWGPAPVLLILPFIILFGIGISDALYTCLIASFSPLILYLLLQQVQKLGLIKLSDYQRIILCIFFAFGTIHFYLSIFGTVWFTSQVISILYLLISLLFITKFSEFKSLKTLIVSSIFFGLAVNSRTTLIFYTPLFLSFLLIPYLKNAKPVKSLLTPLVIFVLIGILLFALNSFYNYFRFGSFFENGYRSHHFTAHFSQDQQKYGFLNSYYIPKNFYYMFVNLPPVTNKFPFFSFDSEGNSILFTSPLLLILILIIKKKYWRDSELKLINFSILLGFFLTILLLLHFWGTGWVQFGYRYLLDIVPFLIILLAEVITELPIILITILLVISILINFLGTLWFLNL